MALFPHSMTSLVQQGVGDLARCGLPYNHQPSCVSAAEAAAQAGRRLLTAAMLGDDMQAMRCVADGANPNFADPVNGETPLHRAAQRNQSAVIEVLVSLGADVNRPDRASRTPLYTAANAGCLDAVNKLLTAGATLFPEHCSGKCNTDFNSSSGGCCGTLDSLTTAHPTSPRPPQPNSASFATAATATSPCPEDDEEAALLALRATCPLAAAAAAARWPVVAALLAVLPPDFRRAAPALRSLRFLVWALASHRAFPPAVISALPQDLPRCVVDAVRPAHLASTPLVLATGNDQQQLMQWLLARGADPELGAPLLLCAGRFCRGSCACCVSTLLRRGAAPHVAWADTPADSPLRLAAAGDCFSHVHVLVAYGADVAGEAARVREVLYAPAPWEAHLDELLLAVQQYGDSGGGPVSGSAGTGTAADLLCPCGQQHARWPGLWPPADSGEGEEAVTAAAGGNGGGGEAAAVEGVMAAEEAGAGGNSCNNQTPADDAWYRRHCAKMEQLQDGTELAECRKAVDELWRYGCSAVVAELGGAPSAPHSLLPRRVLAALQDVIGGWLAAAARCSQQRQLRVELYDAAVAEGRALLDRKRVAALAALSGAGRRGGGEAQPAWIRDAEEQQESQPFVGPPSSSRPAEVRGLVRELRLEILALAGLAPPGLEPRALSRLSRASCGCPGCDK